MTHRAGLPQIPTRIARLPIDDRGYPVPWFVAWMKDGNAVPPRTEGAVPDFRVMDPGKRERAVLNSLCWICGGVLGVYKTFVIGPMCAVNRVTSEPGAHTECAIFSALACPFLSMPKAKRREHGIPEGAKSPGVAIDRNPGVTCLWTTTSFRPFSVKGVEGANDGWLISLGKPTVVEWYAERRRATREEVEASIAGGYPLLLEAATKDGPDAIAELEQELEAAKALLPA